MGKALVIGVVVIIVVAIGAWFTWKTFTFRPPVGDMNVKRERELWRITERAAGILVNLGPKFEIEDSDLLSEDSKEAIQVWLSEYYQFQDKIQKEINA